MNKKIRDDLLDLKPNRKPYYILDDVFSCSIHKRHGYYKVVLHSFIIKNKYFEKHVSFYSFSRLEEMLAFINDNHLRFLELQLQQDKLNDL